MTSREHLDGLKSGPRSELLFPPASSPGQETRL